MNNFITALTVIKSSALRVNISNVTCRLISECLCLVFPLRADRMLYTELLQLWQHSVEAVDAKDWPTALAKLNEISEPTSRTLFNTASCYLALWQLDLALKVSHSK